MTSSRCAAAACEPPRPVRTASRPAATALVAAFLLTGCLTSAQPANPRFDGGRALEHVRALVAIGPRPAGSSGARETRDYVIGQLTPLGLEVQQQAFDAQTPLGIVRMVNLRATAGARSGRRLIVAGHYDTKLFTDRRFVGANDGGSSTAFLIEFARALQGRESRVPVEFLFLDGEEAVVEWKGDDNTYGSRHYVEAARRAGTLADIGALVLVDMIGDRDLRLERETQSSAWLTDLIWRHARALGKPQFVDEATTVLDDHVPFLEAGVSAVDIIDLDYPSWHEASDTLDKLSADSLQAVGDVLLAALPDIEARISRPE